MHRKSMEVVSTLNEPGVVVGTSTAHLTSTSESMATASSSSSDHLHHQHQMGGHHHEGSMDDLPASMADLDAARKAFFFKARQQQEMEQHEETGSGDFRSHSIAALRAKAHEHSVRILQQTSSDNNDEENVFVD